MSAGGPFSDAREHWTRWLWLSAAVIAFDQVTKHVILAAFRSGEEMPVTSFFSLVLAFNAGAAFSFLAGADGWQRWLFMAIAFIACGIMLWLLKRGGTKLFCAGIALIIGGALGNLYDRVIIGASLISCCFTTMIGTIRPSMSRTARLPWVRPR